MIFIVLCYVSGLAMVSLLLASVYIGTFVPQLALSSSVDVVYTLRSVVFSGSLRTVYDDD